jgi:hypothetical protein
MFEPGVPWYVLHPSEIHAFGYGLLDGLKVWKRNPIIAYEDIDKLPISPEWKVELRLKYHYYYVGYELPEVTSYIVVVIYLAVTNTQLLMKMALPYFGM